MDAFGGHIFFLVSLVVNLILLGWVAYLFQAKRRAIQGMHQLTQAYWFSETRFQRLSERAPMGVIQFDPQGMCAYVNPHWLGKSGLKFHEAQGDGWLRGACDAADVLKKQWQDRLGRNDEFELGLRFMREGTLYSFCHSCVAF